MNLTHHIGMTFQILVRDNQFSEKYQSNFILHVTDGEFKIWNFEETSSILFLFCCFTAKNLVASLMEVDQDQRLTAQEAIAHEW